MAQKCSKRRPRMSVNGTPADDTARAEVQAKKRPSSAVTSGRKLFFEGADPNSEFSRRFRDLAGHHVADLGGSGGLSAAKLSLCRRAAALEVALEVMESRMAANEDVDLDRYGRAASHLRRILESLGLERLPQAPFLEAHVVGTPWSPMQARLKAEAAAEAATKGEAAP
jgi:hypothetical protein